MHITFEYSENDDQETAQIDKRKLEIKIAQLNAKLQLYLAGYFGLFAGGIALAVFGIQIFLDQLPTYPAITLQMLYSFAILIISSLSFLCVFRVKTKLNACLNEFDKLQ